MDKQAAFVTELEKAERLLARRDPILRPVIKQYAPCGLRPHTRYFETMVGSIVSQQLSTKAADTIFKRFKALYLPARFPKPEQIAETYYFMNNDTYEQIGLHAEELGDDVGYLLPETNVKVEFFEGQPISVTIPGVVELTVVATEPEIKGATVSNVGKPAQLETGITIQVPAFIKEGEKIRVDTTEGRYIERAR